MSKRRNRSFWVIYARGWGVIPIFVYIILELLVLFIGKGTDAVLRSMPRILLSWFGIVSALILIFWLGRQFLWKWVRQVSEAILILRVVLCTFYGIIIALTLLLGLLGTAFGHHPEYITERNGVVMVASVHSFLQTTVDYYEYKNPLFRGKELLGWEDYGNGAFDPFQSSRKPVRSSFDNE